MSHCVRASKYRIDILLRGAKGFSGFSVCWCWAAFFTWLGSIQNQRIPGSAGSEGKWGANLFQEEIRFIQEGPWQGWGAWNENHILPSQTHPFLHLKCSSHGRWSLVRKFFLSRQVSKLQCTIVTVKCLVFILLKDTVRYVGRNYPALWVIFPSNDHPPPCSLTTNPHYSCCIWGWAQFHTEVSFPLVQIVLSIISSYFDCCPVLVFSDTSPPNMNINYFGDSMISDLKEVETSCGKEPGFLSFWWKLKGVVIEREDLGGML